MIFGSGRNSRLREFLESPKIKPRRCWTGPACGSWPVSGEVGSLLPADRERSDASHNWPALAGHCGNSQPTVRCTHGTGRVPWVHMHVYPGYPTRYPGYTSAVPLVPRLHAEQWPPLERRPPGLSQRLLPLLRPGWHPYRPAGRLAAPAGSRPAGQPAGHPGG